MPVEIYVLSDRKLALIAEWQQAIDDDRRNLTLSAEADLRHVHGALPVMLDGRLTSFERDWRNW